MTFSIVARSADGSCGGVAVASKHLAAGAAVPAAEARAGAGADVRLDLRVDDHPDPLALGTLREATP